VLLGHGDGTFQTPLRLAAANEPRHVLVADLNGDSDPDLVMANAESDNVSALLGNGDGTFQAQQSSLTGRFPMRLAVGDLDGAAIPDLAVAAYFSGPSILLSNGDGTVKEAQVIAGGQGVSAVPVAVEIGSAHV